MTRKIAMTVSEAGRKGGLATLKALTRERRREIARKAAQARWGKKEGK